MIVIMDIEWIKDTHGEINFTQIEALRTNEDWTPVESFSAIIRPPALEYLDTSHVAFNGYQLSAFMAGEQEGDALRHLASWLLPTDVLCFWHQEAANFFRMKWRRTAGQRYTSPIIAANARVFFELERLSMLPSNPYTISKALGLQCPEPAHCSKNDVAVVRQLIERLEISQNSLLRPAQFSKPCQKKPDLDLPEPYIPKTDTFRKNQKRVVKCGFKYIFSEHSGVFHTSDCCVGLRIGEVRGCVYYKNVGNRRPCKICNPQPDLDTKYRAATAALEPAKPKVTSDKDFEEMVYVRLLGGNRTAVKLGNIVGYCHNCLHPGKLTKSLLDEHQCIEKQCTFLQKYEGCPFWVNQHNQKAEKQRRKLQKKAKKELAVAEAQSLESVRDALRDCVPEEESHLDIIRVERIKDRHFRVFYVSDNRFADDDAFPRFAKLARESYPWWLLQMRHIRALDGHYVTRSEFHAKKR